MRAVLIQFLLFIISISLALPVASQSVEAQHKTIVDALLRGDYGSVEDSLRTLQSASPERFEALDYDYLLARLMERDHQLAPASLLYQRVFSRGSILGPYALWHLAGISRLQGDRVSERKYIQQLISIYPNNLLRDAARMEFARSLYESQDYPAAITAFRAMANERGGGGDSRGVHALLGNSLLKNNEVPAARAEFSRLLDNALKGGPDDYSLAAVRGLDALDSQAGNTGLTSAERMRRAGVYQFNRDFEAARRHYQQIVKNSPQDPNAPEATYQTGRGFVQERKYPEALAQFELLLSAYPSAQQVPDTLGYKAGTLARLGRVDESVATYSELISRFPNSPSAERAPLNIVDVLRDAGRDEDALARATKASSDFKGRTTGALAQLQKVRILAATGRWNDAIAEITEFEKGGAKAGLDLNGGTSSDELIFLRGLYAEQAGDTAQALKLYLSLVDGRDRYYGQQATSRLRALGQNEQSRRTIESEFSTSLSTAKTALAAGKFDDARVAGQRALRLTNDANTQAEIINLLGQCYQAIPQYHLVAPSMPSPEEPTPAAATQGEQVASPAKGSVAARLKYLGLFDEWIEEVHKSDGPSQAVSDSLSASKGTQSESSFTTAVYSMWADRNDVAVRYAESFWKNVPADYYLPLAPKVLAELLYPPAYRSDAIAATSRTSVDPRFVLSIARQESRFRASAKSNAAARGLMQFIPSTAADIASKLGSTEFDTDELYEPRVALLFGATYLDQLFKLFPAQPQAVAASYNGGEDAMARWKQRSRSDDPDRYVCEVGFGQSKDYVMKVVSNFRNYSLLYDQKLNPIK